MKKLIFTTILVFVSLLFTSCSNDDDAIIITQPQNTIADFVGNNSDYSSLKAALDRADLTNVLSGSAQYTVFAPNNDAFDAFLLNNGFSTLEEIPVSVLQQVLLNHVIQGLNISTNLSTGYVKTMAEESSTSNKIDMFLNTSSGVEINGGTQVVTADILVDNGVIHAVNNVINLPTVVTFATADSTFSTLVAALTRENTFTYVTTLSTANGTSPAPFTVFAPTNDAFGDLLVELNAPSLDDIATATLEATLNTHVVGNANVLSSTLTNGMTVTTLGDTFTINTTPGVTFVDQNDRTGNVIVADVQASNGIIHVIDKVILPNLN